jgi:hypothetical protein
LKGIGPARRTAGCGNGYTLHGHTAGDGKGYTVNVQTAGCGKGLDPDPGGQKCPTKVENFLKVHVLKCWMAFFES